MPRKQMYKMITISAMLPRMRKHFVGLLYFSSHYSTEYQCICEKRNVRLSKFFASLFHTCFSNYIGLTHQNKKKNCMTASVYRYIKVHKSSSFIMSSAFRNSDFSATRFGYILYQGCIIKHATKLRNQPKRNGNVGRKELEKHRALLNTEFVMTDEIVRAFNLNHLPKSPNILDNLPL